MNRREFLQGAGAALLVASGGLSTRVHAQSPGKKVLVLGAGLAGLAAAYELNKAGFDVTVLEARTRPGGRVFTARDPFADGLYAEMGPEYVDHSDEYDHRYCKEFDLKVLTAKLYDAIFVRGKKFKMAAFQQEKQQLPFAGTQPGMLFAQERHYVQKLLDRMKDLEHLPPDILKFDNLSVAQLLLQQGAPEDVIALYTYLNATEETARPEEMSSLSMLKGLARSANFTEAQNEGRIFGGNDQLPKAFARALAGKILYDRPVRKIAHGESSNEVWFEENGSLQSITAPFLVIAIPFKVLRNIELTPEFSSEKMNCIRTLSYGHVMKIAMQYKERFWDRAESIGQRVFTDTRLRRIYHTSIDQPGPRGILLTFTSADDAVKLGALPEKERLQIAVQECAKVWPEAPKYWEGGITKFWDEDPWIQGSYSFTGVGQDRDFLRIAQQAESRVHFAGEHTSVFRASMNGAIESGVRACEEIKKQV